MNIDQKLIFITGKGGVGKSYVSAMLAHNLSSLENKKVLLIETEPSGALARYFEHGPVGYSPVEVFSNIFLCEINTQDALSEYLNLYAKIPSWAKFGPLSKLIDIVAYGAPGVKEILVVGKIAYEFKKIQENQSDYDCIIVDSPATGHIISLLEAPWSLKSLVSSGLVAKQTKWMSDILENKDTTGVFVVTNSDEVVLAETSELIDMLRNETHTSVSALVVNKNVDLFVEKSLETKNKSLPEIIVSQKKYFENEKSNTAQIIEKLGIEKVYCFPSVNNLSNSLRNIIKNSKYFEMRNNETN